MAAEWQPAWVEDAQAFSFDRHLLLVVKGLLTDPLQEVDIRFSPNRIYPPMFEAVQRDKDPGQVRAQVMTPYQRAELFFWGAQTDHLVLSGRGGSRQVPILGAEKEAPVLQLFEKEVPWPFKGLRPSLADLSPTNAGGMGYSKSLSLDEAFQAAMATMPDPKWSGGANPQVDKRQIKIDEIGEVVVTINGIAGFSVGRRLFVRVSTGPRQPAGGGDLGLEVKHAEPVAGGRR